MKKIMNKMLKNSQKEALFSGLYSLLDAGLDFSRSFLLLIEGERDRKMQQLLKWLYESVVKGNPLWKSCENSGCFSSLDYGIIRVGEETGRLNEALAFLTDYYKKRIEQRRMVVSALSYPLIVLSVALVVLFFMILVIVPMFEQVYQRMGGELPGITLWMIRLSRHFPMYLAGGAGGMLFLLILHYFYGTTDRFRQIYSGLLLRTPVIGDIIRKNAQAKFCYVLYLLHSSGVSLVYALELLKDIITFYPYCSTFPVVGKALCEGKLLADCLGEYPRIYHRKLVALIRVGEETNRLAKMLQKQGDELTKELEYRLKQLGNILEPLLILGVGSVVALVLIAMYMPMFRLGGIIN